MDALLAAIANAGNIAVIVLVFVIMIREFNFREERRLEREARTADTAMLAKHLEDQTDQTRALVEVLTTLRVQLAEQRRTAR